MASKTERQRSTLNLSPIAPPATNNTPSGNATEDRAQAVPDTKAKARTYRSTDQDERRLRAAYAAVSGINGRFQSFNDFRVAGMLMLAEQLEAELNNSAPFQDAPERFRAGRPIKGI